MEILLPKNKFKLVFSIFILFSGLAACSQQSDKSKSPPKNVNEELIKANQSRIEVESERIEAFINRRGWKMEKTGTGLRYMISQKGKGPKAKDGEVVKVNFKVSLLDGTVCYSSDEVGPQEFLIGMDNVESGLHEGILFLNQGAKATFILPSHLAHGLTGDQNKIPGNASIVYDIEILDIK